VVGLADAGSVTRFPILAVLSEPFVSRLVGHCSRQDAQVAETPGLVGRKEMLVRLPLHRFDERIQDVWRRFVRPVDIHVMEVQEQRLLRLPLRQPGQSGGVDRRAGYWVVGEQGVEMVEALGESILLQ